MKIYNQDKTKILENVDLTKGYLLNEKIKVIDEKPEQFHFEYIEYENGGKDKIKIVDVPYVEPIYEEIQRYILYSNDELIEIEKRDLKQELDSLTKDFIQVLCGAIISDFETRKQLFMKKHNRLRELENKPPRQYN